MASTTGVSSAPILEVLNRNNYKRWRLRIKTYLLAEDLWEVVEAIREPTAKFEDDELEYKAWKQKNAKALYAIQNSCGSEMFHFIRETEMAKNAWKALEKVSRLTGGVENSAENFEPYIPFTEFVSQGDWDKAKEYLKLKELEFHSAVTAIDPRIGFKDTAIHLAARRGHVNIVKELVLFMTQEDLKMKNGLGATALHAATWSGQLHTVKELVSLMGEEINTDGDTALHIAVSEGKVDILKELVLLMRPKDLKIKNNYGYTALHLAVKKENVPIVKDLAALMGDVRGPDGDTAVHIAVKMGEAKIVRELVLLMRGEDLAIKNDEGYTALHLAVKKENVPIVKDLAALVGDVRGPHGDTALHIAVKMGEAKIVRELVLLMRGEDLAIKNDEGYTAFHLAVQKGNAPIVKEFMTKEKERDFDSYIQFTTHVANGDRDNAKEWLTKQDEPCDAITIVDPSDGYGNSVLHVAAREGHVYILKDLISLLKVRQENLELKTVEDLKAFGSGINLGVNEQVLMERAKYMVEQYDKMLTNILNVQNAKGSTTLHLAVRKRNVDIVKELVPLMRKEGIEIKDADGDTALNIAVLQGHVDIVKELVPLMRKEGIEIKDANGDTALNIAVLQGHVDIVKELVPLMRQEGLEVKDNKGSNALHLAVRHGRMQIVRELMPFMRKEALEEKDGEGDTALNIAVLQRHVDIVKELAQSMRQEGLEVKDNKGSNALHLAVKHGHMQIVRELMPFMRQEALEEKDGEGYTALGRALRVGKDEDVMEIAKYMAGNNDKVFGIQGPPSTWTPVVMALDKSRWDLCCRLYPLTPLKYLEPQHGWDGASLIIDCFRAKKLDMALDILRRCPILAISPTCFGCSPIMELAGMHSAFLGGTQLGFWQHLIYNRIRIEHANLDTPDTCINISKQEDDGDNQMDLIRSAITLYRSLVYSLLKLLGVNRLRRMKWIHTRSNDVLRCISEMLKKDSPTSAQLDMAQLDIVRTSIFKAVEHGNVEFVTHICEAHPQFTSSCKENRNIFHLAIESRQHKVFSLIHRLDKDDQRYFGTRVTVFPENMLHLAGKLSPLARFNHIHGAALQMQRELQWFKEVEDIVPLEMHEVSNSDGMTPDELFNKNHEKLKEEAENSMKGTATSCTVVGALIVTIMFAAAFTVPGGNNDSTGAPMFLAKKLFLVFIISDTLSLVSSTTSVMLFLGILTSRYAKDDFLKNLPTKMMIGLLTLFLSIATMMIAFSSALIIMLDKEYSWAIIPSLFAASIPVASFIWLQFPLLIEIFWSTYGPGIFDKKAKSWIKLVEL